MSPPPLWRALCDLGAVESHVRSPLLRLTASHAALPAVRLKERVVQTPVLNKHGTAGPQTVLWGEPGAPFAGLSAHRSALRPLKAARTLVPLQRRFIRDPMTVNARLKFVT